MRNLLLTIVDVIGILVPGILLVSGVLGFPGAWTEIQAVILPFSRPNAEYLRYVLIATFVVGSYVLGYLNRLWSIRLLQRLVGQRRWTEPLKLQVSFLEPVLETAIGDSQLCDALQRLAPHFGSNDPAKYAPLFHFAKRIVRGGPPSLWAESERLEAEMRFIAGLFLPLALLSLDAGWAAFVHRSWLSAGLGVVAVLGIASIVSAYPSRRVREVVYNYLLALVALRHAAPNQALHPSAVADIVNGRG